MLVTVVTFFFFSKKISKLICTGMWFVCGVVVSLVVGRFSLYDYKHKDNFEIASIMTTMKKNKEKNVNV